jgi:DNA mismatch repair endonuclease MutH
MEKIYTTAEEVFEQAQIILNKTLRDVIPETKIQTIEEDVFTYKSRKKGLLGDLVEVYVFGKKLDGLSRPDFEVAGVELKTTPLKKHSKGSFVSKERLVFSMINYDEILRESWEDSSFLKKNKVLLLMFYLWTQDKNILDYEFKFTYLLNLLKDISQEDVLQIKKDWEFIVEKIRRGEAHLLSEGDTYYLGACTKAANSKVVRDQPKSRTPAKPRAFSFKQQYINHLVKTKLLGEKSTTESIFKKQQKIGTIEDVVKGKFAPFIGKTDTFILSTFNTALNVTSKNYKRSLVNRILGVTSNSVEELEKANITLKVITLEPSGVLKESISFPAFDYKELVSQVWYDEDEQSMADFHLQLETKKFLFVIFQKQKDSNDLVLKKTMFWNFPMKDLAEAERVWTKAVNCIHEGVYDDLPKISDSYVAHVRPHGKNAADTVETPQGTQETKRCFWLNAKYIQSAIETEKDQA